MTNPFYEQFDKSIQGISVIVSTTIDGIMNHPDLTEVESKKLLLELRSILHMRGLLAQGTIDFLVEQIKKNGDQS